MTRLMAMDIGASGLGATRPMVATPSVGRSKSSAAATMPDQHDPEPKDLQAEVYSIAARIQLALEIFDMVPDSDQDVFTKHLGDEAVSATRKVSVRTVSIHPDQSHVIPIIKTAHGQERLHLPICLLRTLGEYRRAHAAGRPPDVELLLGALPDDFAHEWYEPELEPGWKPPDDWVGQPDARWWVQWTGAAPPIGLVPQTMNPVFRAP